MKTICRGRGCLVKYGLNLKGFRMAGVKRINCSFVLKENGDRGTSSAIMQTFKMEWVFKGCQTLTLDERSAVTPHSLFILQPQTLWLSLPVVISSTTGCNIESDSPVPLAASLTIIVVPPPDTVCNVVVGRKPYRDQSVGRERRRRTGHERP